MWGRKGWVQLCLHVNVPLFVVYSSFLANRPIVVSAATHTHIYFIVTKKRKKGTSWKNKEADRLSGTREKWLCLLISMARVYSKMGGEKRRALNDSEKNEVDQRNSVTPVGLTKNEKGFGNFSLRPNSIFHSWREPNRHVYVSGLFMGLLRANKNRIYQFRVVL